MKLLSEFSEGSKKQILRFFRKSSERSKWTHVLFPLSEKSESNLIEPQATLGARKRPHNKKNRMENAYFWILRNEASNLPSQTLSFPFIPHGNELPKFAFELKNFQGLL